MEWAFGMSKNTFENQKGSVRSITMTAVSVPIPASNIKLILHALYFPLASVMVFWSKRVRKWTGAA